MPSHLKLLCLCLLSLAAAGDRNRKPKGSTADSVSRSSSSHVAVNNKTNDREGRLFLPLFQIVTFPNDVCASSSSSTNGTCYTSDECSSRGGASSGSCASGYGVCCVFSMSCGDTSSENNTYLTMSITSTVTNPDPCVYTICPVSNDICRIKLNFNTFNIASPQVGTAVALTATADSTAAAAIGDCVADKFTITSPGKSSPPVICGFNTGQHMILDATNAPNCHKVTFDLSGTGATRSWDIAITQYTCGQDEAIIGPPGCLQYFTGTTGTVASFNWPTTAGISTTTTHLSNQDYSICNRVESGFCAICWGVAIEMTSPTFGVSVAASAAIADAAVDDTPCNDDYLTIPGGQADPPFTAGTNDQTFTKFCGRYLNAAINGATAGNSVCSNTKPFRISFKTDGDEVSSGIASNTAVDEQNGVPAGIVGFQLRYILQSC